MLAVVFHAMALLPGPRSNSGEEHRPNTHQLDLQWHWHCRRSGPVLLRLCIGPWPSIPFMQWPCCQALAAALKKNNALTHIDLAINRIGVEGTQARCLRARAFAVAVRWGEALAEALEEIEGHLARNRAAIEARLFGMIFCTCQPRIRGQHCCRKIHSRISDCQATTASHRAQLLYHSLE